MYSMYYMTNYLMYDTGTIYKVCLVKVNMKTLDNMIHIVWDK